MIGALMYLTSSRPDIVHVTCLCARYQAKPTENHLKEVKRIFRYLRGTVNTGLWYIKDFGFELTGFSDGDYAGCKDTFKSTFGGAQFLGEKLVSWSSKKQDCTALSIVEAKYVFLSACCAQVLWMRTQLTDYGFHFNKIPFYCDSKSAISCNLVQHSRTKHIAVRYHFIKEHVEKGTIELYFVKTNYQLANIFTKALPTDRFNYLLRRLGLRSLSPKELEPRAEEIYPGTLPLDRVEVPAIAISCNPVQHSRTKHIAVRYHFIKEHVEKGTIELYFVKTDYQLADIFTKALPSDRFNYLVRHLGMRSLSPKELERLVKSQIRRCQYNITPAESKFRPPMLDHQDKYMMKAQVHVSKSSAISDVQPLPQRKYYCQIYQVVKHLLRGRLLASFQDHEHEGTRSQGGIKDNDSKI
nr:copia protein [Tanacetum cinerariifolium]